MMPGKGRPARGDEFRAGRRDPETVDQVRSVAAASDRAGAVALRRLARMLEHFAAECRRWARQMDGGE
jgi:hypothetical protein